MSNNIISYVPVFGKTFANSPVAGFNSNVFISFVAALVFKLILRSVRARPTSPFLWYSISQSCSYSFGTRGGANLIVSSMLCPLNSSFLSFSILAIDLRFELAISGRQREATFWIFARLLNQKPRNSFGVLVCKRYFLVYW